MFLSEWCEFPLVPCLEEKKTPDERSRFHDVEIARVSWHAFFQPVQQEKTCNSANKKNPVSKYTFDSVLRLREVVRAKDLSAHPPPLLLQNVELLSVKTSGTYSEHWAMKC